VELYNGIETLILVVKSLPDLTGSIEAAALPPMTSFTNSPCPDKIEPIFCALLLLWWSSIKALKTLHLSNNSTDWLPMITSTPWIIEFAPPLENVHAEEQTKSNVRAVSAIYMTLHLMECEIQICVRIPTTVWAFSA